MNNLDVILIREKMKLSQTKLGALLGVSIRTIQNWEAGEKIPKTKYEILRNLLELEPVEKKEEKKYKVGLEPPLLILGEETPEDHTDKSIPLIPLDAIAGFGTGEMQIMDYDAKKYVVPEFTEVNTDYMIRVKGSSMYPKYNSGDIVACRKIPVSTFFQWNKVYVLDTVQGAMIKRVHKSEIEGSIKCISDNDKYEPFDIPLTEIYSLAIVVGVIRLE